MQIKKINIVLSILLPIQYIIVNLLKSKTYWIENIYARQLYPNISKTLRIILGWIPFSFGDIFALFLIALILFDIYLLFKNKGRGIWAFLIKFTGFISVLYFCFYAFWGMNYFREPLAKKLSLQQAEYSTEQLINTTKKMIAKLNEEHCNITNNDSLVIDTPLQNKEIFKLAYQGYQNVALIYPNLNYKHLSVKPSLVSYMHMYTGTSGYFNPITGEAQINSKIPRTGLPATTCHEMAHQIGWSAENDANFVSFLTCIHNSNTYFKYAGYRMAVIYLIKEVRRRDKEIEKELWQTINKGIIKDFINSRKLWQQYKNPIEPYIKKGYNSYLKANNQTLGIKSYSYVVDLLIAYDKENNNK